MKQMVSNDMTDLKATSLLLESLLELKRKAVAVKFLLKRDDFISFEAKGRTRTIAYCSAVARASQGESHKLVLENFACLGAAMALGFIKPGPSVLSGERRLRNGSYENLCTSRSVSKDMVYCEQEIYGVGIVPLGRYTHSSNPDIVILITDPYNAMRIVQGYAYRRGQVKELKMVGLQAICQECTSYPFETNSINISMMCAGTRLLGRWTRDELGIGIPFNQFGAIVDGIRNTVNPFERNEQKRIIEQKLKINRMEDQLSIEYNKNYDDGAYRGLKGL